MKPRANVHAAPINTEVDLMASWPARRRICRALFEAGHVSVSTEKDVAPIPGVVRLLVKIDLDSVVEVLKSEGVTVRRV